MGSGKRPVDTCICDERGISRCLARLTDAICHGGEFSSQVSRSGVGCCSAAVVALGVGSCSAAFERSGVFAGQRRAAAGSAARQRRALAAAAWCWQRQRGCSAARQSRALAAAAWRWQRHRVRCSAAAERCVVFAGQRSAARQPSALAVVVHWRQRSGGQDAAAQRRQRALSAAA